jgi:hypothetical protein
MSQITVTFTLASGTLVVGPSAGVGSYWVPDRDSLDVAYSLRYRSAPDSDVHPGRVLLAYTTDQSELNMTIYAHASSAANLATMKANLAAALLYPGAIAVNQDGVTTTYTDRWPALPKWEQDSGMANAHLARAVCVVPVNPI